MSEKMVTADTRDLPIWAWFTSAIFFPLGPFMALSAARVVGWPKGVAFAVLSYVPVAGIVVGMTRFAEGSAKQQLVLIVGLFCYILIGAFQFKSGVKREYWDERGLKIWKRLLTASVFLVVLVALGLRIELMTNK